MDGSREMNVPARLAAGERLYRDVVYHYGPAGPWIEGAALAVFGRRFLVLHAVALAAAALLFAALAHLTARAGSRLSACLAVTWTAALCIGAPNGGSFLYPYSFDALFALAGALLCLAAAAGPDGPRGVAVSAGGLALALASKPEVGAAAAAVLAIGWLRAGDRRADGVRRTPAILGAGAGIAALLWTAALAGLPLSQLSPEGPFALLSPPKEWRAVYAIISGLADPSASLQSVATALFLVVLIVGALALLSRAGAAGAVVGALGVAVATGLLLTSAARIEDRLPALLSPMPLAAAAAALALLWRPLDPTARARFLLFAFSAAFAARVVLGVAYGAVTTPYSILAAPGLAASAAVMLFDMLPGRLGTPPRFRALVALLFAALSVLAVARWRRLLPSGAAERLETAAGSLRLPHEKALPTAQTLAFLAERARPGDTLSGAPEAGFFSFVTSLSSPLRQEQIFPGHLDAAAESRLVERIERAGPRFFLIVGQPAPAFGARTFGVDYAADVGRAIARRYRRVASFGGGAPTSPGPRPFSIDVFERAP